MNILLTKNTKSSPHESCCHPQYFPPQRISFPHKKLERLLFPSISVLLINLTRESFDMAGKRRPKKDGGFLGKPKAPDEEKEAN